MSVEAKQQKQVIIDEIKAKLENAQSAVVIDYMGINVAEADAMRKKLREANVDYTVGRGSRRTERNRNQYRRRYRPGKNTQRDH